MLRPSWHRSDVSDCHAVRSHAVIPDLMETVCDASPRLAPCMVTLEDPVEAAFLLRATLTPAPSNEKPSETLPSIRPALSSVFRLPKTPCPDWHRIDVSDSHAVCSHIVPLDLAEAVYDACPTLDP